jgi:hypothetical protein
MIIYPQKFISIKYSIRIISDMEQLVLHRFLEISTHEHQRRDCAVITTLLD